MVDLPTGVEAKHTIKFPIIVSIEILCTIANLRIATETSTTATVSATANTEVFNTQFTRIKMLKKLSKTFHRRQDGHSRCRAARLLLVAAVSCTSLVGCESGVTYKNAVGESFHIKPETVERDPFDPKKSIAETQEYQ